MILQVGSNSIHVSSYIRALNDRLPEIHLLAEEQCHFKGVAHEWHVSFRSLDPFSVLRNIRKLRKLLTDLRPDVIHIHQVNRLAYFVTRSAAKLKIPVVSTAWGSDVLLVPKQNAFFRHLVRKSLERSALVTADSHEMIAAMMQLVPVKEKYVWLQYGIDPVAETEKEKLIYSNRLHKPLYRIDRIVRYFAEFTAQYPEWILVIGATGPETIAVEELVEELGLEDKVVFEGWLDNEQNRSWYAKAAVYVSVPESDGTSVSVLEAMSAGCIPVLSDLEVSREWITDGVNGVIEKAGKNPLVDAMRIDPARCAEMNRQLVAERAERSACIAVFYGLYERLSHAE
jgi:glycosyltransferase involved in cell wall biosynthesis